jgi:hypothetical protein
VAILRAAAAAGILLVVAPEQTRDALSAIFLGVEDIRKAAPKPEDFTAAAARHCAANPDACARLAREAAEAGRKLSP